MKNKMGNDEYKYLLLLIIDIIMFKFDWTGKYICNIFHPKSSKLTSIFCMKHNFYGLSCEFCIVC